MITWKLIMKILGYMRVVLLPLMILATTMGSSIASPTGTQDRSTLEESTSLRRGSPEQVIKEELPQSQTGSDITEALQSLNRILNHLEKKISEERSSQSTPHWDEPTMKRPDNSSSTTCSPSP